MSGGVFSYLYRRPDASAADYAHMSTTMAQNDKDREERWRDIRQAIWNIAQMKHQAELAHERMVDVLQAIEWWHSGDYSEEQVEKAIADWRDAQ